MTKQEIIKKFQLNEKDTSSTPVQIAVLTDEINKLSLHLQENKKDFHSRAGLYKKVGRRRKLLDYYKRKDADAYQALITELGLRR